MISYPPNATLNSSAHSAWMTSAYQESFSISSGIYSSGILFQNRDFLKYLITPEENVINPMSSSAYMLYAYM